jgi:hypothetical protein
MEETDGGKEEALLTEDTTVNGFATNETVVENASDPGKKQSLLSRFQLKRLHRVALTEFKPNADESVGESEVGERRRSSGNDSPVAAAAEALDSSARSGGVDQARSEVGRVLRKAASISLDACAGGPEPRSGFHAEVDSLVNRAIAADKFEGKTLVDWVKQLLVGDPYFKVMFR